MQRDHTASARPGGRSPDDCEVPCRLFSEGALAAQVEGARCRDAAPGAIAADGHGDVAGPPAQYVS